MPGDTTLDGNANDSAERSTIRVASTNYRCNSCQTSFLSGQDQRAHMKEAWHVHNVKRRIASLSPVPRGEFDAGMGARPVKKSTKTGKNHATSGTIGDSRSQSEEETEADDHADGETDDTDAGDNDENVSPYQCLFCNHNFTQDDTGFSNNLEHIQTAHGLFIPDRQLVADLQSFISYLATEIRTWHECLYCGATKPSTEGIQSHMRDKGHCFLNFDREPELLDFWERPPSMDGQPAKSDRPIDPFETEFQLATGKVIGSRHAAPASKKPPKSPEFALVSLPWNQEDSEPLPLPLPGVQSASSRQLARGEEMGLVGISHQQRQALVLAEKKAQRSEMMARKAREWVYARGSNSQKFDQIDGSGKWGKQNHKLQPR